MIRTALSVMLVVGGLLLCHQVASSDPLDDAGEVVSVPDASLDAVSGADRATTPTPDTGEPVMGELSEALRAGRWLAAGGMIVLGLVGLVRSEHADVVFGKRFARWLKTDRGGVIAANACGLLTSIGLAMIAERVPGPADIAAGFGLSVAGSGLKSQWSRLFNPPDRQKAAAS